MYGVLVDVLDNPAAVAMWTMVHNVQCRRLLGCRSMIIIIIIALIEHMCIYCMRLCRL